MRPGVAKSSITSGLGRYDDELQVRPVRPDRNRTAAGKSGGPQGKYRVNPFIQ